ncbi:MAG: hypothetical protein FWF73_00870 [Spirochaetes bacterium]|nr:hypothetical protein [Spirochaetota bacterium]
MNRIEEFTRDGKKFVYIDFSNLTTNDEINQFIAQVKPVISKYPQKSVYTITNMDGLRFDKETKEFIASYTESNKPYVISGAIFGLDGLKKVMATAVFALSGRKDLAITNSKEEAIQILLKK